MVSEPDEGRPEETRSFKLLSPGTMISHYKIVEKIGAGGMGVVYKALDTKLDRTVALKFLPPRLLCDAEARARFEHEAKSASALSHNNITTIHEIDEVEGRCFIAMEYIEGKSIKELTRESPLSLDEIVDISLQIGKGLHAAHKKGVVHRDVKSDNIMVSTDGVVKIMDFGLAKLKGVTKITKEGTTVGTLQYMSPEQLKGRKIDQRSDIFSSGVVLYEMITGRLPFRGDDEAAVIHSILNETPEPLARYKADVPDSLQRIVDKALSKDKEERYQHADELVADLKRETHASERITTAQISAAPPGKYKRWTRGRSLTLVSVVALACVAAYLILSHLLVPTRTERVVAREKSIAVLPFKNMIPDPENEWFSDGITEDIITQLSKISDLKVISRTSVMLYKDTQKSLPEIGEELGVAAILEGSVRRSGDRVRIVGQLVDAKTDEHLWAETYDREMKDIFDIQSDVARKIAAALEAELSAGERELLAKRATENLSAYDYYLKGRDYYYRYRKEDNENAIELFEKALRLDPDYVLALAGVGDAYCQRVDKFGFDDAWIDSSVNISLRAIEIDPDCAEAYKALALGYAMKGWLRKAIEADRKALELNPNYFPSALNLGVEYFRIGRLDEALKQVKRAVDLDPTFALSRSLTGWAFLALGDDAQAEIWMRRGLELQPDLWLGHYALITLHLVHQEYDEALAQGRRAQSIAPDRPTELTVSADVALLRGDYVKARGYYEKAIEIAPDGFSYLDNTLVVPLGLAYWKTGQRDKAKQAFASALDVAQTRLKEGDERSEWRHSIAAVHAAQGDKEEAYRWLQKSIDAGYRDYRRASKNPLFESLHGDQRFEDIMADLKTMVDDMRRRVEDD
jgi:serine/threonine protein kinase/Tfp pilus assembly protein PilF